MTTDQNTDSDKLLTAAAGAAGMIGVATLSLEVVTDRWLARVVGVAPVFMSTPLGVGTALLGGVIARENAGRALPALLLAFAYWAGYLAFW